MAKGSAKKRDNIKSGDMFKPEEQDVLSPVDKGKDFVKQGETA
jgi:hypothetical protein